MSNRELSPIAKELIAARSFIDTPDKWTTETRLDSDGRMCALGAIDAVHGIQYSRDNSPTVKALAQSAHLLWPEGTPPAAPAWTVADYNNNHPDGHAAVLRMFNHAIQEALNKVPETV